MMPLLTVFTPTYNRANLLVRGYRALQRQTSKNFLWMIIDDGSTDNTAQVVAQWQQEDNDFEIQYYYKENGGLHTGYNTAIEHLTTELAVCVDSDDYLTDDAVETIESFWTQHGSDDVAGIEALDCFEDGSIVGDCLPNQPRINLIDLQAGQFSSIRGDKKVVVRSTLYESVAPQPSFPGEKNFNPHYMHLQISQNYDFLVLNQPICCIEYQEDGMTTHIFHQYANSPRSFAQIRRLQMTFSHAPLRFRIKTMIHYDAECLLAHRGQEIINRQSPNRLLGLLLWPAGWLLRGYILRKARRK